MTWVKTRRDGKVGSIRISDEERALAAKQRPGEILRIKSAVRSRDGNSCVSCGMGGIEHRQRFRRALDVHRINPGSRYAIETCVTLCRPCHSAEPKSPHHSSLRMLIDADERHKRAFYLFAAARGLKAPEAFEAMIQEHFAKFLALADEELQSQPPSPPKPKPKKAK